MRNHSKEQVAKKKKKKKQRTENKFSSKWQWEKDRLVGQTPGSNSKEKWP